MKRMGETKIGFKKIANGLMLDMIEMNKIADKPMVTPSRIGRNWFLRCGSTLSKITVNKYDQADSEKNKRGQNDRYADQYRGRCVRTKNKITATLTILHAYTTGLIHRCRRMFFRTGK